MIKVTQKKLDKYKNLKNNELFNFYLLDLEIKEILFKYLERLEDSFKFHMIDIIGDNFLCEENFKNKFLDKRKEFNIEKVEKLKKRNIDINGINFFMELTFGETVRYFKDLDKKLKFEIVKEYRFKKIDIFENWIFSMRYLKNLVCHGENIFNRKFKENIKGNFFNKKLNFENNSFFTYLLVLEIFNLNFGEKESIYSKILDKEKNSPVWGQISKKEIEAWQVFIKQGYSTFMINQDKKEVFLEEQKNKKIILITGGTGYIGSHGVVAFEQAGYKTVIIDNLSNSSINTLNGIEKIIGYKPDFYEVDLRNKDDLEKVFRKYNFDGVIHFAGLKAVGESCEKPNLYFDNNINGSNNLFLLMEKFGVKNIVFSSSATVYSPENIAPLSEVMTTGKTTNPYGRTKYLIENILQDLAEFSGFRVMNLRYFNPIGAHSSGELGENPRGLPNNLLPFIMKVATGKLEELKVFGGDYTTIDGTGVRDYIDVIDLIEGHLKAYKNISSGFQVYNLGVGKGISVLEMISETEKIIGKKINYKIVERRAGDLAEVYCNPKKALKELGWKTKISLKESLKNSWKFYNKK